MATYIVNGIALVILLTVIFAVNLLAVMLAERIWERYHGVKWYLIEQEMTDGGSNDFPKED